MTIDPASAATGSSNIDALSMGSGDGYSLSPESILQWLNRRLGNRDELIHSLVSEVENQDLAYKNISNKIQALQAIKSAMSTAGKDGNEKMSLKDIHVTWNGQSMTADQLLNLVGIDDLATAGTNERTSAGATHYYFTDSHGHERELPAGRVRQRDGHYQRKVKHHAPRRDEWVNIPEGQLRIVEPDSSVPLPEFTGEMQIAFDALSTYKEQLATRQQTVNTGRDMLTTRLQSEIQGRSQDITLGTQLMRNVNDSRAAILRNIR